MSVRIIRARPERRGRTWPMEWGGLTPGWLSFEVKLLPGDKSVPVCVRVCQCVVEGGWGGSIRARGPENGTTMRGRALLATRTKTTGPTEYIEKRHVETVRVPCAIVYILVVSVAYKRWGVGTDNGFRGPYALWGEESRYLFDQIWPAYTCRFFFLAWTRGGGRVGRSRWGSEAQNTLFLLVGMAGIEPGTFGFTSKRSGPTELSKPNW